VRRCATWIFSASASSVERIWLSRFNIAILILVGSSFGLLTFLVPRFAHLLNSNGPCAHECTILYDLATYIIGAWLSWCTRFPDTQLSLSWLRSNVRLAQIQDFRDVVFIAAKTNFADDWCLDDWFFHLFHSSRKRLY